MPNYCHDCGRLNRDDAKFCIDCGFDFSGSGSKKTILLDKRYKILQVIQQGGMGCVYRAKDTRLDQEVALKKMLTNFSSQKEEQEAEERFFKEAKILCQLHHGGIPKVSDFFVETDPDTGKPAHFLIMTLISGKNLETLMKERNESPLSLDVSLHYFRQILDILSYLHSQNPPVIYRDIKPSNIMVYQGKLVLVDFGIARIYQPGKKGTVIGTPGYASPEQYQGLAEPVSDLFSLGV